MDYLTYWLRHRHGRQRVDFKQTFAIFFIWDCSSREQHWSTWCFTGSSSIRVLCISLVDVLFASVVWWPCGCIDSVSFSIESVKFPLHHEFMSSNCIQMYNLNSKTIHTACSPKTSSRVSEDQVLLADWLPSLFQFQFSTRPSPKAVWLPNPSYWKDRPISISNFWTLKFFALVINIHNS